MLLGPRPLTRSEKACLSPLVVLVGLAAWMGAIGCSVAPPKFYQQPDYPLMSVDQARLARLTPGSVRGDVWRAVGVRKTESPEHVEGYRIPQPYLIAQSSVGDVWVEAYEIEVERTRGHNDKVWLYFCADRLIRWGPPFNWPTEAQVNSGLQQASEAKP